MPHERQFYRAAVTLAILGAASAVLLGVVTALYGYGWIHVSWAELTIGAFVLLQILALSSAIDNSRFRSPGWQVLQAHHRVNRMVRRCEWAFMGALVPPAFTLLIAVANHGGRSFWPVYGYVIAIGWLWAFSALPLMRLWVHLNRVDRPRVTVMVR